MKYLWGIFIAINIENYKQMKILLIIFVIFIVSSFFQSAIIFDFKVQKLHFKIAFLIKM
mgnify:CR=1 FL=1